MKNKSLSQGKAKSRSLERVPSAALLDYLAHKYQKAIPLAAITAAQKMYGKARPLNKDDKFVKRFADSKATLDAPKLIEYLSRPETQERGRALNPEAIGRVYENFANNEGKLSFEYIMKMAESTGVAMSAQLARAIVRKYGRRKDHLDLEDCVRVGERRASRSASKSPSKGRK